MQIELVYSPRPRQVQTLCISVPVGTSLGEAVQRSGLLMTLTPNEIAELECGIWGRKEPLSYVLRADDRVELYRTLLVDPKVARRERFVRQGSKSAGLFAKRRIGAKAGY